MTKKLGRWANPVCAAVDLAGGPHRVGSAFDLTPHAVRHWCRVGRVPPRHARALCAMCRDAVSVHELCPDVFPE